jgi:hypothetical protein
METHRITTSLHLREGFIDVSASKLSGGSICLDLGPDLSIFGSPEMMTDLLEEMVSAVRMAIVRP